MKKKSCLMLAIVLCMLQVVAVFAVLPASAAESAGRSYDVYKTETDITVDGTVDEAWTSVPWSDYFVNFSGTPTAGYAARMKITWKPVDGDDTKADFYLLVQITGDNTTAGDQIRVKIDDGKLYTGSKADGEVYFDDGYFSDGTKYYFWNGGIALGTTVDGEGNPTRIDKTAAINCAATQANPKYLEPFSYSILDTRAEDGICTIEFYRQIEKPQDGKVLFDFAINKGYSWNGTTNSVATPAPEGILNLVDRAPDVIDTTRDVLFMKDDQVVASLNKDSNGKVTLPDYTNVGAGVMIGWKDSTGAIYPVGGEYTVTGSEQVRLSVVVLNVSVLSGASVLIEKTTALRFEVSADADLLTALGAVVQEKGIVLAKTADLTDAVTEDGIVSTAELDTAQIAYEKIVLTDSESKGVYYAVKENISDVTVAYSACAYITVKYADDSVKTIAVGGYTAESHSRSVKAVSEAAYADRANVRGEQDGKNYKFKVSKDYAIGDYTLFSYSAYTEEQLDILAEFKK